MRDMRFYAYYASVFSAAILGASGYSGQEVLDRVLRHPELEVVALGSDSLAGESASALDVRLNGSLPVFVPNDDALAVSADIVFLCLGNERAARIEPREGSVVVDLSGVHRLVDPEVALRHYSASPGAWSYGLPEIYPPEGRLIANPGCYATAALLALAPLTDLIDPASVVVDGKSGVSGAGRELKPSSHAGFVLENLSPYRVGSHQHAPEIAQMLGFQVCFVPHLLPVRRGLLATCYARVDGDARGLLEAAYADSAVVRILPEGVTPELARVQHTDGAEIGVFEDVGTGRAVVVCALDNLGKGAAGQALQNANLALGLDETAGLRLSGVLA
jgi:N-acetyl-gamma-glutamyl-phosphate reductase